MVQHLALFQIFEQEQLFYHQYDCKIQSPDDKVPSRPVPHSGQHPDNENVPQPFCLRYAVSAERNINIVAEP